MRAYIRFAGRPAREVEISDGSDYHPEGCYNLLIEVCRKMIERGDTIQERGERLEFARSESNQVIAHLEDTSTVDMKRVRQAIIRNNTQSYAEHRENKRSKLFMHLPRWNGLQR